MMSERKLYQQFKEKIKEADPNCWIYKIPDTFNLGGKKPGDFFCVIQGVPFLLEFKSKEGILTKYQAFQQIDFINASGEALVYREEEESMDKFIEKILIKAHEHKYALLNRTECPHCGVTKLPHKPNCYSIFYT